MSETLSRERLEEALAECAVDNSASSDDLGAHIAALEVENERLRAVLTFCTCGFNCVYYPDQDHDHPGIQYPHCVDPDIECPVADALAALEARHADE